VDLSPIAAGDFGDTFMVVGHRLYWRRALSRLSGAHVTFARLISIMAIALLAVHGCASLKGRDPLQVTVAGIEPLQGEGMELRMLVKLRVQNPNDSPVEFDGAALEMNVQGKTFATGVSDVGGSVPRFGEAVVAVPVTVSAFRMLGQAVGVLRSGGVNGPIAYEMKGKLDGSGFSSTRFQTRGEFDLPASAGGRPDG
jgi:LEA14-like dessication related protein